jgi:hypothetical protein
MKVGEPRLWGAQAAGMSIRRENPRGSGFPSRLRKRKFLIDGGLIRHDPDFACNIGDVDEGVATPWHLPASRV